MNALVVDDSKVMRLMVIRALRQANLGKFDCDEAENGAIALEKFREGEYDIVFLDFNMPEMSGLEFIQQVRSEGDDTPLVMITSEKTDAAQQKVATSGATGYIAKPFTPDDLESVLSPIVSAIEASS